MSGRSYELLSKRDGCRASLSGATQVRAGAVRPEIVIPCTDDAQSRSDSSLQESRGLEPGARVRIIRVPYFGSLATVTEMPYAAERISSGAVTRVLRAKLEESEEIVTVPRANVELLT